MAVCALVSAVALTANPAQAGRASGSIDRTYGRAGISTVAVFAEGTMLTATAPGPGGAVTVAGIATGRGAGRWGTAVAARYTASGALDRRFGRRGIATHPISGFQPVKIAVRRDGTVALVGWRTTGPNINATRTQTGVAMLRPDGSVDTGFGDRGYLPLPTPSGAPDEGGPIAGAAFLSNGKLLVGMSWWSGTASQAYRTPTLVRLLPEGAVDRTFGFNGYGGISYLRDLPIVDAMTTLPDGAIVIGGRFADIENEGTFIARFRPDGLADPTFGAAGTLTILSAQAVMKAIRVEADGSITTACEERDLLLVTRHAVDGSPIASFGRDGIARWKLPLTQIDDVAIDGPGRMFIVTLHHPPFPAAWSESVRRVTERGVDRSYGRRGSVVMTDWLDNPRVAHTTNGLIVAGTRNVPGEPAGIATARLR